MISVGALYNRCDHGGGNNPDLSSLIYYGEEVHISARHQSKRPVLGFEGRSLLRAKGGISLSPW
jgi:hypothetical protein